MPYLAVPVWNGQEWEPKNMADSHVLEWPEGYDPSNLPRPHHSLRSVVDFRFGNLRMRGEIREIKLHGGTYTGSVEQAIRSRYIRREMTYTIYANGHGRWVRESEILSQPNTEVSHEQASSTTD